jgi:hypothetical protein
MMLGSFAPLSCPRQCTVETARKDERNIKHWFETFTGKQSSSIDIGIFEIP